MVTVTRHSGPGGSRYYLVEGDPELEGVRLPNVTSICNVLDKPALVGWAERMGIEEMGRLVLDNYFDASLLEIMPALMEKAKGASRRVKDTAAEHGTEIHSIIENIINPSAFGPLVVPQPYRQAIDNFATWYNNSGLESVDFTETFVYSKSMQVGGTIDAIGHYPDGSIAILDWKTSNGLYAETAMQLCAYAQCYTETFGLEWDKLIAVRLGKDHPDFEVKEVPNFTETIDGFKACLAAYKWKKLDVWGKGYNK